MNIYTVRTITIDGEFVEQVEANDEFHAVGLIDEIAEGLDEGHVVQAICDDTVLAERLI